MRDRWLTLTMNTGEKIAIRLSAIQAICESRVAGAGSSLLVSGNEIHLSVAYEELSRIIFDTVEVPVAYP